MRILGLVSRTHDSGLALLEDGVPTFVLEEERFNREKHTRRFPFRSLKAAFDDRGLSLSDVDVITTPWHMRSLWRMMFGVVRDGFPASLNLVPPSARPTQSTLIVTMPNGLRWGLLWHFGAKGKLPTIVQVRHHDAHAATFFVSPFEEATILVMDVTATRRLNRPIPAREIALSVSPRTHLRFPRHALHRRHRASWVQIL